MFAVLEAIVLLVAAVVVTLYFVFATFAFGAGYQPTFRPVVARMLEFAEVGPEDVLYDLGAGTGAILFRAARERGARVVGVEIEPIRVILLRLRRRFGGPRERVEIRRGNLYETDLRPASVVALFLWPAAMRRLRPRLEADLAPGARVVTHWHEVPGWTPERVDEALRVYLYRWKAPSTSGAPAAPTDGG